MSEHRSGVELAVGIEGSYKAAGYQMIEPLLLACEHCGRLACGYDGMVVGDLAVVEHLLALGYPGGKHRSCNIGVWSHAPQYVGYFRIDVVRQIGGVDTRVSGHLFLIQTLDKAQRLVGAPAPAFVAFHLQRSEVEEPRRCFAPFFLAHGIHGEQFCRNFFGSLGSGRLVAEAVADGCEQSLAVYSTQLPAVLRHKIGNLVMSVHNQRQCGCLDTAY